MLLLAFNAIFNSHRTSSYHVNTVVFRIKVCFTMLLLLGLYQSVRRHRKRSYPLLRSKLVPGMSLE